jgi:putative SOS response-associated peptidase YedK
VRTIRFASFRRRPLRTLRPVRNPVRLSETPSVVPRYNIAPSQPVLCVGLSRDGKPAPALLRWGLVPGWAASAKKAPSNARAETVVGKPTFAEALRQRRCLVPATGFYDSPLFAET